MKLDLQKLLTFEAMVDATIERVVAVTGIDLDAIGWKFGFNNRRRSLGVCWYSKREIQISRFFLAGCTDGALFETLLHEAAHALCPGEEHNDVWLSMYRKLGGTGGRIATPEESKMMVADPEWVVVDTTRNEIAGRYFKKPRRDFSKCWVNGRSETIGKLKLMSFEEFKSLED